MYVVESRKITDYLLSTQTPEAEGKCKFFRDTLGYSLQDWTDLERDLLAHPGMAELESEELAPGGVKFVFRCRMPSSPNGKQYCICSVWKEDRPGRRRFITAYAQ
jgi:hypothetical protein